MAISHDDPDLPLVLALQKGDDSALDGLIEKYKEPLFRFIGRYTRDRATAHDLLQETFVRAYFGIGRFKPRNQFNTWLYSIAANLCRDHARSRQQRQARATDSIDDELERKRASPHSAPDAEAETRERLKALENAIAELPHDLRVALLLSAIEGHTHEQCAVMLGITAKAVETRIYRARKLLLKNHNLG